MLSILTSKTVGSANSFPLPAYTLPLDLWLRRAFRAKMESYGEMNIGLQKQKWTIAEEATLRAGVEKYGPGKWKAIKRDIQFGPSLIHRSNVNMKDKWRNMIVDPNGVGSTRKRPRNPEIKTRGDLNRNEEKKVMAVDYASSGMIMPEEKILPNLLAAEEATKEAGVAACEAKVAEVKAEAARATASAEISQARMATAKEIALEVQHAVEKAEVAVAIAKNAANEAKAAFERAETARTAVVSAAEMGKAQGARAVVVEAEHEAAQEAKNAAVLTEQYFSLL